MNLPSEAQTEIEDRAYLYSFDFRKFRQTAEETFYIDCKTFTWVGICWKFRFAGTITIYAHGRIQAEVFQADGLADGRAFLVPITLNHGDDVCVVVASSRLRWLRWLRGNRAHVTLEGYEQ